MVDKFKDPLLTPKDVARHLRIPESTMYYHRAADHFSDDAQQVPDATWLSYGLDRGSSPVCKDGRIKGRQRERAPVEAHAAVLF